MKKKFGIFRVSGRKFKSDKRSFKYGFFDSLKRWSVELVEFESVGSEMLVELIGSVEMLIIIIELLLIGVEVLIIIIEVLFVSVEELLKSVEILVLSIEVVEKGNEIVVF